MSDPIVSAFVFLIGVVMGSFGNVLIARLPEEKSLVGRSRCPHCGYQLKAWENFPILSFLILRAHCRKCKRRISLQYPIIELLGGILFLLAFWHIGTISVASVALALSLWLLLLIATIDMRTQLMPDSLNIPFIVLAVIYAIANGSWNIPAVAIACGFFVLQWIVSRGRWIGSGDLLLSFGIGWLFASWQQSLLFLFIAYVTGAVVASVLLLNRKTNMEARFAFGPFLVFAAIVTVLYSDQLLWFFGFA